jgi:hypothetical protein
LLEAHDKNVLDSLSSPTSYVCFRPNDDAFLIFHVEAPTQYSWQWEKLDGGAGERQHALPALAEFRDGVLYRTTLGIGYWYRFGPGKEPTFKSEPDERLKETAAVFMDDTEIFVDHPFKNQNGGTTQYSLTIRRSTGRFVETFAGENAPITTHSGTCLIYR